MTRTGTLPRIAESDQDWTCPGGCGNTGQVPCTNHGATPAITYTRGGITTDHDTCGECDQPNDWGTEPGEDGPPMKQCDECL